MAAPENKLKQALGAGEVQIGIWLAFGSAAVAEQAAGCGFDWCLVDSEHSPNDPAQAIGQLRALGDRTQAVMRVPVGEDWVIKRALDLGVQSLMVPMVETAAQAEAAVRAMRYPPEGVRGMGPTQARATRYGLVEDYVSTANAQICCIVQVESAAALAAAPEIAALEGVDCVFIGPADLSADMGYPGQADHPAVEAAIAEALPAIEAAGAAPGILAFDAETSARYLSYGARFLGVGADVTSLRDALRGLATQTRQIIGVR
ncbi:HpcH/HpaI aldolase family protein [Tropicimonas sp. S265A]|uniref:HpcH/HpaI aldolase family protein n=1 Tax=Tropicimonas sp. S265A TaxID=3415134 RepID=UPI003C7B0F31